MLGFPFHVFERGQEEVCLRGGNQHQAVGVVANKGEVLCDITGADFQNRVASVRDGSPASPLPLPPCCRHVAVEFGCRIAKKS